MKRFTAASHFGGIHPSVQPPFLGGQQLLFVMGAIFGRKFVRDDKIDGQGKQFLLFAKKINMQKYEVDRIYEVFFGLENKVTHLVDIKEMFHIYRRPYTLIASVIMQVFDRSKTGQVNLMEFVLILWCFLATDEDELARLCFDMFDIYK